MSTTYYSSTNFFAVPNTLIEHSAVGYCIIVKVTAYLYNLIFFIPAGLSGWGIAYYINDTLIPVLKVTRGVTYTFVIEAGDNANDRPRYHPFYITDSIEGGILLDTPEDRLVG